MKTLLSIIILSLAFTISGQKISLVADINQTPDHYYIDTETQSQDILFIFQERLYMSSDGNTFVYDGINPARIAYKYNTPSFYVLGDTLYFGSDNKLFRYEGSTQPAELGHFDDNPMDFCSFNGKLYFSAGDTVHGIELWEYNGQDVPSLVADISPGLTGSNPGSLIMVNNELYFIANGNELWAYDGNLPPYKVEFAFGDNIAGLRKVQNVLCIIDKGEDSTYKLWRYGGASPPEFIIDSLSWGWNSFRTPVVFSDELYFSKISDEQIWRYNGINPPEPADELGNVPFTYHCVLNNRLYYGIYGPDGEVWVYDGINPPVKTSSEGAEIEYRDILYYTIHEAHHGSFFWQCDKINPPKRANFGITNDSDPQERVIFNNKLYFLADDGIHGNNLWEYDGISEPSRISDTVFSNGSFFKLKTFLYIRNEKDIWRFNGKEAPEKIATWDCTGTFINLCELKGRFYFETGINGIFGLWSYDGTYDPIFVAETGFTEFAIFQDRLYFRGYDSIHGYELWVCDGLTPAQMVYDIYPGSGQSYPQDLLVVNNTLFFSAYDPVHGRELWKYDSISHQLIVEDILEGEDSSYPSAFAGYNNKLYFGTRARTEPTLWVYDGTNKPQPVIFPYEQGYPTHLVVCNNKLIIQTSGWTEGPRIWQYDELKPPELLADFSDKRGGSPGYYTVLENSLYFIYDGIWQYNGNGTPMKIDDELILSFDPGFTVFDEKLYFPGTQLPFGNELWVLSPFDTTLNVEACSSYVFKDSLLTSSGIYYDTISVTADRDSVIKLLLTLGITRNILEYSTCESYTSPSGKYIWETSGIYTDTIHTLKGCDSIITVYLSIGNNTTSTFEANACNSFTSPSGNYIWTESGTYLDTIPNSIGCDSVITLNLTIDTINAIVSQTDNTLNATTDSPASFQWLDCGNDYEIIQGETNNSFTPQSTGSYAVEIVMGTCADTSECYELAFSGIMHNYFDETITAFPNPTKSELTIKFTQQQNNILLILIDLTGNIIAESVYGPSDKINYIINASPGIYLLQLVSEDKEMALIKVIKN